MSDDLRARWATSPWNEIRQSILAPDRPRPDWSRSRPPAPWGYDLRGIDLRDQSIIHAELIGSRLNEALLHGTRFLRCSVAWHPSSVEGQNMSFDHCFAAGFFEDKLHADNLTSVGTFYASSCFSSSQFRGARFTEDDLSSCRFDRCDLTGVRFTRCDLNNAHFTGSTLNGSVFEDCDLDRVDLRGVALRGARLLRCTMDGAEWEGADLTDADVKTSIFPAKSPPR